MEEKLTEISLDNVYVIDWGSEVTINADNSESSSDASLSIKDCSVETKSMCDSSSRIEDTNALMSRNKTTENMVTESESIKNNYLENTSVDSLARISPDILENIVSATECNAASGKILKSKEKVPLEKIKFSSLLSYRQKSKEEIIYRIMGLGLYASNMLCPKCNKNMELCGTKKNTDGFVWKCKGNRENKHKTTKSVRTGSFLSKSNYASLDMLLLIHCWVYKVPRAWVQLELNASTSSLADWYDFFRDVCVEFCERNNNKIGGIDKLVEIEGGEYIRWKNGVNAKKGSFVYIGTEDMCADVYFFKFAEKCDKNNFLEVIKSSVLPGSTIVSQFCGDYMCHTSSEFADLKKTHLFQYRIPESDFAGRKNFWDVVRKRMPSHRTTKGFDNFLAEFLWRKQASCVYDKMREFLNCIKTIYPPQ